jgi:hypothetical protein
MNQQPDKLFRSKLQNFQKPVSIDAWSKLEHKLEKKQAVPVWMKVAASVLIITSATTLFLLNKTTTTQVAETKTTNHMRTAPIENKIAKDSAAEKAIERTQPVAREYSEKVRSIPQPALKTDNQQSVTVTEVEIRHVEDSQSLAGIENEVVNESVPAELVPANAGITLVYSATEVNEKYLIKKDTTEATTENEKTSTLQKLWSKAKNLKHNQDPIGELRQKKNEILALDFSKDKQGNQNR